MIMLEAVIFIGWSLQGCRVQTLHNTQQCEELVTN